MSDEQRLTELHEAGHAIIGVLLGRPAGPVTVQPGGRWLGCAATTVPAVRDGSEVDVSDPMVMWPAEVRSRIEGDVVFWLAGDIASRLLGVREGRVEDPVAVVAADAVSTGTLPAATASEASWAASVVDGGGQSDSDLIREACWLAHGDDWLAASAWLRHLEEQTRALVGLYAPRILQLAGILGERHVVGAEAVGAIASGRPRLVQVPA